MIIINEYIATLRSLGENEKRIACKKLLCDHDRDISVSDYCLRISRIYLCTKQSHHHLKLAEQFRGFRNLLIIQKSELSINID